MVKFLSKLKWVTSFIKLYIYKFNFLSKSAICLLFKAVWRVKCLMKLNVEQLTIVINYEVYIFQYLTTGYHIAKIAFLSFASCITFFVSIQATVDTRVVRCAEFQYFCAEISREETSGREFSVQGVNGSGFLDNDRLIACQSMQCIGKYLSMSLFSSGGQ